MSPNPIQVTPSAYRYPLLVKQLLLGARGVHAAQEIVYRDLRRMTYRTFADRVGRLANALAARGVQPGDVVAVMDWDSHRYLEAYFAVPMMGATLMTVNVRLAPEQIEYTLAHCGAKLLLAHDDFAPLAAALADKLPHLQGTVRLSDDPAARDDYEAMLAAADAACDFPDFDEDTRATVFYTTGTTGLPKGVSFSHRQLVLHTLAELAFSGSAWPGQSLHRGDVYMPLTPMFHVHAWGVPYAATAIGLKQVYPGRYEPQRLVALRREQGVSYSHCVPTVLQMILGAAPPADDVLKGWKIVIGGSALPQALAAAALERGIDVWAGYGMSETCPLLTSAQLGPALAQADAPTQLALRTRAGIPAPLVELRVVDEAMQPLPHDGQSAGEIVVRAPWLTMAYLDNPPASEALWAGGWLHTQDIGTLDEQGWLRITDRLKDVIKTGGEWVSSIELEDLIAQAPGVAEVAVFGVPDARWGERPVAFVVPQPGSAVDEAAVRAHVARIAETGRIGKIAVPDRVHVVPALPRTSVGKIDKKRLRAEYAAG
jgi:fatty-acyl-CoA synthase